MKEVILLLVMCFATGVPLYAQKKKKKHTSDSVNVVIRLLNASRTPLRDSVLVIFDRYDRRGAGVIKKVFYPVNNEIVIMKVPPARYYIEISCLNAHRDKFTELTYVNNRHPNVFTYRVRKSDTFIPGLAVIPAEPIDVSKLTIFQDR